MGEPDYETDTAKIKKMDTVLMKNYFFVFLDFCFIFAEILLKTEMFFTEVIHDEAPKINDLSCIELLKIYRQ